VAESVKNKHDTPSANENHYYLQ